MFGQTGTYFGEFLAESNVALGQEDERNQLGNILTPIIAAFQNEKRPITAYTLARSAGASSRLAFFSEFASFVGQVMQNLTILKQANYIYFVTAFDQKTRENTEIDLLIQAQSEGQILTMQIAFLNQKLEQLRLDTIARYPYASRYLSFQVFHKLFSQENLIARSVVSPKTTLAQYLDSISGGFSYATVGLPVLCGVCQTIKEQSEVIDTAKVQWSMLESIARNISLLVRTSTPLHLALFLKEQTTMNKIEWFQSTARERSDLALSDKEILQQIKQIREKLRDRTRNDIEYIVLPETSKQLLRQLVDWASLLHLEQRLDESQSSVEVVV